MKIGIIIVAFFMVVLVSGETSIDSSPAPSPDLGSDVADSPSIHPPISEIGSPLSANSSSPAESPNSYSSPPEPEIEHSPSPSPSDSPSNSSPMPDDDSSPSSSPSSSTSPSPEAIEYNHSDITGIEDHKSSGGGGTSGGKKIAVALGAVAALCVVGFAGFVYKKRQENIRRSRYGYAAREIL